MNKIPYIFIMLFLISCESNTDGLNNLKFDSEVLGRYEIGAFNSGIYLDLKPTGDFVHQVQHWWCTGGGEVRSIRGEFVIKGDSVILKPKSLIDLRHLDFDGDNVEKDSVAYYDSDSTYLKKEYHIVKWDSMRFLLSEDYYSNWGYEEDENDFEYFAHSYNAGFDVFPNPNFFSKSKHGYSTKGEFDKSSILKKYQSRFLDQPIVAKIIEVKLEENGVLTEEIEKKRIFKLNKGSNDGVMKKMNFYGEDGCCNIRITKVENSVSFGHTYFCYDEQATCGVGGRVSTLEDR